MDTVFTLDTSVNLMLRRQKQFLKDPGESYQKDSLQGILMGLK